MQVAIGLRDILPQFNTHINRDLPILHSPIHAGRYWMEGLGPSCVNGELYGFSQPLLQLIRPLIETPVCFVVQDADLGINAFCLFFCSKNETTCISFDDTCK